MFFDRPPTVDVFAPADADRLDVAALLVRRRLRPRSPEADALLFSRAVPVQTWLQRTLESA